MSCPYWSIFNIDLISSFYHSVSASRKSDTGQTYIHSSARPYVVDGRASNTLVTHSPLLWNMGRLAQAVADGLVGLCVFHLLVRCLLPAAANMVIALLVLS